MNLLAWKSGFFLPHFWLFCRKSPTYGLSYRTRNILTRFFHHLTLFFTLWDDNERKLGLIWLHHSNGLVKRSLFWKFQTSSLKTQLWHTLCDDNEGSGDWSDRAILIVWPKEAKAPNFRILAPKLEKLARKNEKNNKA